MGQIQAKVISADGAVQVTEVRTRFTGATISREDNTATTLTLRNGTDSGGTIIYVLKADGTGLSEASMILPAGDYILFKDGIHATAAGTTSVAVVLYQS